MTLYTVFLEYGGGTYIAQVLSESPTCALAKWMADLRPEKLKAWKLPSGDLKSVLSENPPLALDDVSNVWCVVGNGKREQILINVVATVQP